MNSVGLKAQLLTLGVKISPSSEAWFMPKPKSPERPQSLLISVDKKVVAECRFSETSPFSLIFGDSIEKTAVHHRDIVIEGIRPLEAPSWYWKTLEPVAPNVHVGDVFHIAGVDRLTIFPWDGCWFYHFDGLACAFCGAFCGTGHIRPRVLDLLKIKDYDIWWRTYGTRFLRAVDKSLEIILAEWKPEPHFHFMLTAGNLPNPNKAWQFALELSSVIQRHLDLAKVDSYLILEPPKNFKYIGKAYEIGYQNIFFNLEFDKESFDRFCKGKSIFFGYKRMLDALNYALKIFGAVRTNFVLTEELCNSTLKACKDLGAQGVTPSATVFWPKPHSLWEKKSPPSASTVEWFYKELAKIYHQYNLTPAYCELSSRSSLENEAFRGWL
ncbi:MAG: hypothetical protein QXT06_04070 [Candidatus Bathyarchaeia archaeon]